MNCDGIVKIACLSWYKDEDDCIIVLNQYNEEVLLNPTLSKIWETVDKYKDTKKCFEVLADKVTPEKINSCLEYLIENELIKIYEPGKLFDSLFS